MTRSQKVLLELIRYEFSNQLDAEMLTDVNWNEVFAEAAYQRMIPFVYDAVINLEKQHNNLTFEVDSKLMEVVKRNTLMGFIRNTDAIKRQKTILQALEKEQIHYCILKGTSISAFYTKPQLRALGDFDVYVKPADIAKASQVIESLGYEFEKTATQYHSSFTKDGYEIELHNSVAGLPYGKARNTLSFLKELPERSETGNLDYGNYKVPSTCDNGIIQLLHMLHHIKHRGMKVRLLCDWMMFVDKNVSDEVWHKEIESVYQQANLAQMAKVLTKLCKCYLGLNNPNVTWCDDIHEKDCHALLEYVMEHDKEEKKDAKMIAKQYESTLREDVWEYKGQQSSKLQYYVSFITRNVGAVLKGEKSIKQSYDNYTQKKAAANKLLDMNLFDKRSVAEYAYRD